jgi:protein-tyrosine phosphatase
MSHGFSSNYDHANSSDDHARINLGNPMPQADGCSSSKAAKDEEDTPAARVVSSDKQMPSFLKISHEGMLPFLPSKIIDLTRRQK